MNFPPRAGRVSGRATPSLRHAPRAKLQSTDPGSSPLNLRGIRSNDRDQLFVGPRPVTKLERRRNIRRQCILLNEFEQHV